jgi:arylsulfatase A-like enzyme
MWWEDISADSPWALGETWPTLAQQLRDGGGYATHMVGKWDLGHANRAYWPTARGCVPSRAEPNRALSAV